MPVGWFDASKSPWGIRLRGIAFGGSLDVHYPRRLSDFQYIGCKPTAAVHFLPSFWPIATAMSQQIRQKLPSLGSNLVTPLFENASMPKVRQSPGSSFHQNGYKMKLMNFLDWLGERRRHDLNVKQRPQPTKMACRRADFSRPWRVETLPYAGHACFMLWGVLVEHGRLRLKESGCCGGCRARFSARA